MPARRYNCGCGKRRFRDERSALAAAETDQRTYGGIVAVYRCPGGLAWHLSAHGFTPGALRSIGRRLAYELAEHGRIDVAEFRGRVTGGDLRRSARVDRCAEQMTELGLTRRTDDGLVAADRPGLLRVVQIGLDAYARERG
ncbi:hypothetical protein ACQP2F_13810 [Actinoplanes sp. CA-030573]|uniref:hypothetical protein n=1 Tax=Actinoplanes sp. CA-030573 TaxID=3239898 RepID=UPI003D8E2230